MSTSQPSTSNQSNPAPFSRMQPPVPLPSSAPLLRPGQPNLANMAPSVSSSIPANESDEAYAKRILSEPKMMNDLFACSQVPQLCDSMMELIESNDSRLFNVGTTLTKVNYSWCSISSKTREFLWMQSSKPVNCLLIRFNNRIGHLSVIMFSPLVQRQQQMQQQELQPQQNQIQPQQMRIELTEQDVKAIQAVCNICCL